MNLSEFRRNLPRNPQSSDDYSAFAPIYDPVAVKLAMTINRWIGVAIAVIGGLALVGLLFAIPSTSSTGGERNFGTLLASMLVGFVAPIFLAVVLILLVAILPGKIGVNLNKVYSETRIALEKWLPESAGPFGLGRDLTTKEFVGMIASGDDGSGDNEETIINAAKAVAQGRSHLGDGFLLLSNRGIVNKLYRDESGLYRLK